MYFDPRLNEDYHSGKMYTYLAQYYQYLPKPMLYLHYEWSYVHHYEYLLQS